MTGVSTQQRSIVLESILRFFPQAKVSLFGSRRGGDYRPDSDLDLLVDTRESNDFSRAGMLREELENDSRLPFRVDLVFLHQIAPDFLQKIQADLEPWN